MVTKKVVKKAPARTAKKAAPAVEVRPVKTAYTQTQIMEGIAKKLEMRPVDVKKVFKEWESLILRSLHPKGIGEFTVAGLVKFVTRKVPARKAGVLVRNPATGEMMKGKAKPASIRVKARPLTKVRRAALG